ncbi:glutathione-dependent formaldehyde dehydrogenase [Pseudomonas capeferrum]|uniref:zinc-dependent alcohol dehydrogenase n=1 Tax=Pseudomonas capeferrum TaxID=1495066 RepID=UPI0015E48537|nr:zinc-dependent alcohol dehydrogenase [Pseudomonas capeferrum]MBA1204149.1 glutathione-dependent formaldehyde dehydrogenase [Pseudomonas capeferrum]
MRALTYRGVTDVRVETVPDPKLQEPDDIVLKVTATSICGSDLHLYRRKNPAVKVGDILGHEFMGVVEEVGSAVTTVKRGDRVVIPFVIACGECFFCQQKLYAACATTNTAVHDITGRITVPPGAALFGYGKLHGGIPGGQAEYVRVPKANVGPFKVPDSLHCDQALFLADTLPTAWQAVINADVGKGSSLAIFGAGPVGLLAAACARVRGVEQLFIVDEFGYRLDFAQQKYGAIPIDFSHDEDPAGSIIRQTPGGRGVDAVIDAVGLEARGSTAEAVLTMLKLEGSNGKALRQCITAVRRGGVISVPGVYAGSTHGLLFGDAFDKGLNFRMGQTHVHRYLPELLEHIEEGRLEPGKIITHHFSLEDATRAYEMFDEKQGRCIKVVINPAGTSDDIH